MLLYAIFSVTSILTVVTHAGLSKRVKFTIRSLFRRVKVPVAASGIP